MGSVGKQITNGTTGYDVINASGDRMTFYFQTVGDTTFYKNTIGEMGEPTPNNMTESEFIQRIKNNGGTVTKKTDEEIAKEYSDYRNDREATNKFLDAYAVRNSGADLVNEQYRNTRRAFRINRRR